MRNRMFKLADQSSHKKHRHAAWLRPHAEMFQDYSGAGLLGSAKSYSKTFAFVQTASVLLQCRDRFP